jgi:hypothetical protein
VGIGMGLGKYQRETKIVLIGDGRSFKYEFDCSKARIPALAAVSPNLETGPVKVSSIQIYQTRLSFERALRSRSV